MKKRILSLLLVLALAAAVMIPAAVAEEVEVSMDPFEEITEEFKQARNVEPYQVMTRPTRVTGWVSLRWAPSKSALLMATYPEKQELTVLKETANWLLVTNAQTGDVGYLNKTDAAEPGEAVAEKPLNPRVVENGKTDLGVIDINGAFSLQCRMADGYSIVPVKSTSDQMVAIISSEDPSKPVLQLCVAYDEKYADVERLNDLSDEEFAVLEKTFTDVDPTVEITYGDTGLGTRLMIVRQSDSGIDYLDFMSIYKGYFVECVMVPSENAQARELTEDQIQMCVDFLTEMDFVPAETAGQAPEGRWLTNLSGYDEETGTVKAELLHGVPLAAEAAEALQAGDILKIGRFSEAIEKIEQTEDGDLVINDELVLRRYGDAYHLYVYENEYTEPFADLTLTIPDDIMFEDGIDPTTGEALDEPTRHTAEEFRAMLASGDIPGFDEDNTYVTFDANGNMLSVEREYVPWQ